MSRDRPYANHRERSEDYTWRTILLVFDSFKTSLVIPSPSAKQLTCHGRRCRFFVNRQIILRTSPDKLEFKDVVCCTVGDLNGVFIERIAKWIRLRPATDGKSLGFIDRDVPDVKSRFHCEWRCTIRCESWFISAAGSQSLASKKVLNLKGFHVKTPPDLGICKTGTVFAVRRKRRVGRVLFKRRLRQGYRLGRPDLYHTEWAGSILHRIDVPPPGLSSATGPIESRMAPKSHEYGSADD